MHKYFAIDQVGKYIWFQPVEKLVGRPELVCDRSGRWHVNSNQKMDYRTEKQKGCMRVNVEITYAYLLCRFSNVFL